MNALKPEKNHKVFLYNDIAKIIVETQGISRKQVLNLKWTYSSSKSRKKTHLTWQL